MISLWTAVAHAACTVIAGATAHLPEGPQPQTTIVLDDGRIAALGTSVPGLSGSSWNGRPCARVEAAGRPLTAGLVAAPSAFGLVEVDLELGSHGDDPRTDDPVRAAMYAADAYDPRSVAIPVNRITGVTSALSVPEGGFVAGFGAWVRLAGPTQADAVVDRDAALVLNVPTGSFADGLRQIRELVADVRTHASKPALYDAGRPYFPGASRLDLEALRPVVEGKIPVLVGANEASDLEALIRLKQELGLNLVVHGAVEGWLVADALAAAKIPVIVDPLVYGPQSFDAIHARPDNAALLAKAGVELILPSGGTHTARVVRQAAGNAVREGLPKEAALRAITSAPARVFGQAGRGTLALGSAADVVLWTGDPLELSTAPVGVWIGGEPIALVSRQTELRDKYRSLPGTPGPALGLPPR